MSSAREIADARLARGELTVDEHSRIVHSLNLTLTPSEPPPLPVGPPPVPRAETPSPPAMSNPSYTWRWIAVGTVAVAIFLVSIIMSVAEGLSVGNLEAKGTNLSFKLANSSSKSEDALLWIEQSGIEKCERVIHVDANSTYNITMDCPTISAGKFTLKHQWASFDQNKTLTAIRIKSN